MVGSAFGRERAVYSPDRSLAWWICGRVDVVSGLLALKFAAHRAPFRVLHGLTKQGILMSATNVPVDELIRVTRLAGEAIMAVYHTDFDVDTKSDDSPVTKADLAAHEVIAAALAELTPEIPLLSEESVPPPFDVRQGWDRYWLIDPLDGTKEFINRNDQFTVNIALLEGGEPVFGCVGVPAQDLVYVGDTRSGSAFVEGPDGRRELSGRPMRDGDGVTVVASRSHGSERLERYIAALGERFGGVDREPVGSSLKLCILAQGEADLYPRLGLTSEWDIAAAHAVLKAAGGDVWAVGGDAIAYNKPDTFLNPEFFAVSDARFDWRAELPEPEPKEG